MVSEKMLYSISTEWSKMTAERKKEPQESQLDPDAGKKNFEMFQGAQKKCLQCTCQYAWRSSAKMLRCYWNEQSQLGIVCFYHVKLRFRTNLRSEHALSEYPEI